MTNKNRKIIGVPQNQKKEEFIFDKLFLHSQSFGNLYPNSEINEALMESMQAALRNMPATRYFIFNTVSSNTSSTTTGGE